jgi:hypothetical protein
MIPPREGISRKKAYHLGAAVFTVLLISIFISAFPTVAIENYFIENIEYNNNPLLVGAPNKIEHLRIIEAYFGRIHKGSSNRVMSWKTLRDLIKNLFANNAVLGKSIGFYGSNGYCLFSYFVRENTSFKWFSLSILTTNFLCVSVIVVCYIIITIFSRKSSKSVNQNEHSGKNGNNNMSKLQRKITIIIMTDILTWLPFIVVCIINYSELIDTSSWYSVFCIFFLPINSIINPIGIYDKTIWEWIKGACLKFKIKCLNVWKFYKVAFVAKAEQPVEIEMAEVSLSRGQVGDNQK